MTSEAAPILARHEGAVARLTLNRPDKRNALGGALTQALTAALRRAEEDVAVRVVTLAGAGPDFSAGADLKALHRLVDSSVVENLEDAETLASLFLAIRELRKPVVALVHGRALAGGCGLATACDLVLAADSASFGYTEVRLGFVPAMVMAILSRNVSQKQAFELLTTGELWPAREMARLGLVNRVFADEDFERGVEEYVQSLASKSPSAIWLTKRQLYNQDGMSFEAGIRTGATVNVLARLTEDTRAGIAAFLGDRDSG